MVFRFLARRSLLAVAVLLGVTTITFLIITLTMGSYVPGLDLHGPIQPGDLERLRANLGLDRPLYVQYLNWLSEVARGNLGTSMVDGTSVSDDILARLPNTLELSLAAILLGLLVGLPVGIVGALKRGSTLDNVLSVVVATAMAVPQFWLGLLIVLLFSLKFETWGLPWLPAGGVSDPLVGGALTDRLVDRLDHLILPAVVLALPYMAIWSRYTRSSIIGVMAEDFIRTARAKGMRERRVVYFHALRNALMPIVTLVGLELPRLVSGALVVEVVFAWPGIGQFAYNQAIEYDYPAILGVTTFVTVLVVVGNMLADLLYGVLDPRVRLR